MTIIKYTSPNIGYNLVCKYSLNCGEKQNCFNCTLYNVFKKNGYIVKDGVLYKIPETKSKTPLVEILKKKGRYT